MNRLRRVTMIVLVALLAALASLFDEQPGVPLDQLRGRTRRAFLRSLRKLHPRTVLHARWLVWLYANIRAELLASAGFARKWLSLQPINGLVPLPFVALWAYLHVREWLGLQSMFLYRGRWMRVPSGGATLVASRSGLQWNRVPGGLPFITDSTKQTGNVFYVDSGATDSSDAVGYGSHPDKPVATIDYAIGLCTGSQGDLIVVLPGHSETVTAEITLDKADLTIVGLGRGTNRPTLTQAVAGDCMAIDAANCTVENIYWNEATTAPGAGGAALDVNAAFAVVRGCHWDSGANDLENITLTASATDVTLEYNVAVVTAEGPDAWVEIEATGAVRATIRYNRLVGGSTTNSWDIGAINSGQAHTDCEVYGNTVTDIKAGLGGIQFSAAATGIIHDNLLAGGTLGQMLDPGSCICFNNLEQDAVDESATLFPALNPTDAGSPTKTLLDANATLVGVETSAVTDNLHGKIGTDAEMNDLSLFDMLTQRESIGEADIDDDAAVYTDRGIALLTITPVAGSPISDLEVHLDLKKATTGFVAIYTTSKTISFAVSRKIDGTNWRRDIDSQTTARAEDLAGLEGQTISIGHVGADEEVRIEVIVSAEEGTDVEIPYAAYYKASAAATFTPVAAA